MAQLGKEMIRQYKDGDLEKILIQEEQRNELGENISGYIHKDTLVFEDNETVYAIVRPIYENGGRLYICSLIGCNCRKKSIIIYKAFKKIFDEWLNNGINRLEITTKCDFENANRLAKMLGFECEGRMKKFYNGTDYFLWGRVV